MPAVPYSTHPERSAVLAQRLLRVSLFNLLVVALLGVLLRTAPFLPALPFPYHNLLHAHSHFAFGGWVHPVLLALILQSFPELRACIAYRHWQVLAFILPASAWGMLLTFPVQGYGPASIAFSTLSLAAGFYEAVLVFRALKGNDTVAAKLLRAGLGWMLFSALGPFATGPITVLGGLGSPLYYDAIYGYLHFQYNGCFSLLVLALLYQGLPAETRYGRRVCALFHLAVLPTYALSTLWHQPPLWVHAVGAAGALAQALGFCFLLADLRGRLQDRRLLALVLSALGTKLLLQLLSAVPAVAQLAYLQRNFVIAYLHLVLLGFVTLFAFAQLPQSRARRLGVRLFLFSFVSTELLLVANGLGVTPPHYLSCLLIGSLPFPLGVGVLVVGQLSLLRKQRSGKALPVAAVVWAHS